MKPIVKAINGVIMKNDEMLLLYSMKYNNWFLAGGQIKKNETKFEALKRELKEELNIEVEPVKLICTTEKEYDKNYLICDNYLVKIVKGEITNKEPDKIGDIKWFKLSQLPSKLSQTVLDVIKNIK